MVVLAGALFLNAQPLALAGIHLYQRTLSPLAAHAGLRCRFAPTCSRYAEQVIMRDGIVRGGWQAIRRVVRCGPWTPMGTVDPP
ncbi:MAG: membrane protein insertion efficiency factor YidD [Acidobacteriota bacterium]